MNTRTRRMKRTPEHILRKRRLQLQGQPGEATSVSQVFGNPDLENASKACRHNDSVAANWSLERQREILQLHRDGWSVTEITEDLRDRSTNGERFFEQQVKSLIERGIPHPREVSVHRCKTCFRKIITDFCIECEIKQNRKAV